MKRICVYCGSRFGADPIFRETAAQLGRAIAERGIGLVYGGANVGLMGTVADAALAAGGEVIGVIPTPVADREVAHTGLTTLHKVDTMHQRKALMADLSDGFIALPGAVGTMDETFEVWSWSLLGVHHKPIALLNVAGYYDHLLAFIDTIVEQNFLEETNRRLVFVDDDIERTIERMQAYKPPFVEQALTLEET